MKIVDVLKKLMADTDLLLNLHEGTGFYRPVWQSEQKNPLRWGQSIIADDDHYSSRLDGHTIDLRGRAERVAAQINSRIEDPGHHFHYHNTRTAYSDSPHPEMRGSATFFALTNLGVESYGIETSREIESLNLKVKYQSLAINAFLDELGIIPQNPKIALDPPRLEYLLVSVNGGVPYGIPNGKIFTVKKGDTIRIEHVAGNYERGMVADVVGLGGLNDMLKDFVVERPLKIVVKKDQFPCGEVSIAPGDASEPSVTAHGLEFQVTVDGVRQTVPSGAALRLSPKSVFRIEGVSAGVEDPGNVQVNFLGYVPRGNGVNKGEDRGFPITRDMLLKKFSRNGRGSEYYVTARYRNREIGRITIVYEP